MTRPTEVAGSDGNDKLTGSLEGGDRLTCEIGSVVNCWLLVSWVLPSSEWGVEGGFHVRD